LVALVSKAGNLLPLGVLRYLPGEHLSDRKLQTLKIVKAKILPVPLREVLDDPCERV